MPRANFKQKGTTELYYLCTKKRIQEYIRLLIAYIVTTETARAFVKKGQMGSQWPETQVHVSQADRLRPLRMVRFHLPRAGCARLPRLAQLEVQHRRAGRSHLPRLAEMEVQYRVTGG